MAVDKLDEEAYILPPPGKEGRYSIVDTPVYNGRE
jgi:hypothetical protein